MATVVARFLSPWPLGWISATPRPLGVDRGHPPVAGSMYRFFFFFFSFSFSFSFSWCAGSLERETWPLRVAGSLPLAVGVDRGHPQWPDLSFFLFFLVRRKCRRMWVVGGGAVSRRWAVDFFGCWIFVDRVF
jgi:hypothetical protein